jgi:AbrB family looped-hinge helix DNA binding protein
MGAGGPTRLRVDKAGRVVLPAAVRRALGIEGEAHLVLTPQADGSARLETFDAVVRRIQAYYMSLPPREDGMLWSESLIADRRAEAARE